MDGMVVLVGLRGLVLGCRVYGDISNRLKDLGGEGVGAILQWGLYINTAPNVQKKTDFAHLALSRPRTECV